MKVTTPSRTHRVRQQNLLLWKQMPILPSMYNNKVRRSVVVNIKPKINIEIIATSFDSDNKTIRLYTRLTNTGDRDTEVHTLKLDYLKIFAAENGQLLFDGKKITLTIEPCLVLIGTYVEDVIWVLRADYVPNYNATTISYWSGELLCDLR